MYERDDWKRIHIGYLYINIAAKSVKRHWRVSAKKNLFFKVLVTISTHVSSKCIIVTPPSNCNFIMPSIDRPKNCDRYNRPEASQRVPNIINSASDTLNKATNTLGYAHLRHVLCHVTCVSRTTVRTRGIHIFSFYWHVLFVSNLRCFHNSGYEDRDFDITRR